MVLSQSGDLDQEALDKYAGQGVAATTLPSEYTTEEMVEAVMRGSVDEDILCMPFHVSMLHLARYYRIDNHRDWEEPLTAVVGDTVDDFCLYYCLSRLHDGVYWLPKKWLDERERRRVNNQRLRRKGRPTRDYPEMARTAETIVRLLYEGIDYGHSEKQIEIRSVSLSIDDLKRCVAMMGNAHWGGRRDFERHIKVRELSDTSTTCVARVIEENNHMTQQDMTFIGGKSVGRLATPKPKHFSRIEQMTHRWLTSFEISEYAAPPLPFLGAQIALTHECRVAADGIVYLCPGVIIIGAGDIDANLVRPGLAMVAVLDVMLQYFADAGLEIRPSDKGNYLTDTIDRFGGLAEAAKFIAPSTTRAILDLFLVRKSTQTVAYLQEERRTFVNYDGVKECVGEDAPAIIDELVGKDILRRGLIFQCSRCLLASWYDLANLTTEFTCRRCSQRQQFVKANWKSPDEPRWYYALAETIFQCREHDSHLTILALDYLRAQSKRSFQYLPEIDVINFPTQGKCHEIDIACLVDDRIVIGECKTEPLKPSHTDKYEALAKALGRRPDQIVFATSHGHVSEAFRTKLSRVRGGMALTGKELLK